VTEPLTTAGLPIAERELDLRRQAVRARAEEKGVAALVRLLGPDTSEAAALLGVKAVLDDVLPYVLPRAELLLPTTPLARCHDRAMRAVVRERAQVAQLRVELARLKLETGL
jgi:hypothetical protein